MPGPVPAIGWNVACSTHPRAPDTDYLPTSNLEDSSPCPSKLCAFTLPSWAPSGRVPTQGLCPGLCVNTGLGPDAKWISKRTAVYPSPVIAPFLHRRPGGAESWLV